MQPTPAYRAVVTTTLSVLNMPKTKGTTQDALRSAFHSRRQAGKQPSVMKNPKSLHQVQLQLLRLLHTAGESSVTQGDSATATGLSPDKKKRNMIGFGSPMKGLQHKVGESEEEFAKRMQTNYSAMIGKMVQESHKTGSKNTRRAVDPWIKEFQSFCESYCGPSGSDEPIFKPPYAIVEYICVWLYEVVLPRGQKSTNEPLSVGNLQRIEQAMKKLAKFEQLELPDIRRRRDINDQITELFREVRKRLINNKKELVREYLVDFAEKRLSFLLDEIDRFNRFLLTNDDSFKVDEVWLDGEFSYVTVLEILETLIRLCLRRHRLQKG